MNKKLFTALSFLLITLFFINFISTSSIDGVKQGETINLYQTCDNCTYVNVTSVLFPNKTALPIGELMTSFGEDYVYSFSNTGSVGDYKYNVCGDKDGENICEVIDFTVSPSGFSIDSGQSLGLFGSLFLMLMMGIIFLSIAYKSENTVVTISFYTFSVVIFIMAILYTVIIIQQTLFGFDSIITGIESFWFVMKMLITVGIVAFIIILFLIMLKLWRIKRGFID